MAAALRGLRIGKTSGLASVFAAGSPTTPVLTEEDVTFLTPLIGQALSTATAAQFVRFELRQAPQEFRAARTVGATTGSDTDGTWAGSQEITEGALYAYGRSLHIAILKWRHIPDRPDAIQMANRRTVDLSGTTGMSLSFVPREAQRPDAFRRTGLSLDEQAPTIVVDYNRLTNAALSVGTTDDTRLPGEGKLDGTMGQGGTATPAVAAPSAAPVREQTPVAPLAAPSPTQQGIAQPSAATATPDSSAAREVRDLKELVIKKELELERMRKELEEAKKVAPQQTPATKPKSTKPAAAKPPATKPNTSTESPSRASDGPPAR
ncbi:MAG: hypothetical protein U0172_05440 [Nitrospiraceae bacterium]